MSSEIVEGKLVALEGIDNGGKSSHIDRLERRLLARGISCSITKELSTPVGELVWKYLREGSFSPHLKTLLFAADRVERVDKQVRPALEDGKVVLADRWSLSAVVYRGVEGFDTEYVLAVNSKTIQPDKMFLIDIPAELSVKRGELGNKPHPYTIEFLDNARKHYLELAALDKNIEVIDGTQPFDVINDHLFQQILKLREDK